MALSVKRLMERLDDLCFEKVLERDGAECLICKSNGKTHKSPLQPAHVWSRQFKAIRWHLWNIYPVCQNHHGYGIHSNKTLTEDLYRAIIAAMYPVRFARITELRDVFFDVSVENLLTVKREIQATNF